MAKAKSRPSWADAAQELKQQDATPPAGYMSIEEIAKDIQMSEDHAAKIVKRLIKAGRAESIRGRRMSASGALIPCDYYRLIGEAKRG